MEEPVEQLMSGDLRQGPMGNRVRRRLVQSTLFQQGIKDIHNNGDGYKEEEDEERIKDEKEDDMGSKSEKKKRKSREGKTTSNSRGASQSRASKKVTENGREISKQKVENGDSSVIMRSDFFLKISERRQQKRQEEDQLCVVSQEESDNSCLSPNSAANIRTPQHPKQKQQTKSATTPKKKVMNGGGKKLLFKRSPSKALLDEQKMQSFPDLRSEAKMTAEENERLSAGRPIHPFFSSWKVSRKNQEISQMDNAFCLFEGKEESTTFNPVHVFETDKDNASILDWGNWLFSEGSFRNSSSGLGSSMVVSERSVNSLQFDDFPSICCQSTTSTCQNKISQDQCSDEYYEENKIDKADSFQVLSSCQNLDAGRKFKFFHQGSCNLPENNLWTDKYQPRKAAEICGNTESVKFISEWLCLWHEKGSQTRRSSCEDEKTVEDVDYSCSSSDADSENIDEEISLKNVLLVAGPVGSGKSAAIYACAEEHGFQIIEVNASDWRNGALVKQRFGEALESHWLQHKVDNIAHSEMKHLVKPVPGITEVTKGSNSAFHELMDLSDKEDSQQAYQSSCRLIGRENVHEIKTLILFEDVDATLSEDHGFLSTIQQLAQTAKRPIVLTSNKYNPALPNNLDRLEVLFKMPSMKELSSLVHKVCAAENAQIHPCLIDRFVEYCQRDIRKTIMHLQFWCQSQNSQEGNRPRVAYNPFSFDLEAGHLILPKLISWGCPCRLSELVEEEVTKSLMMMEESNSLVEIVVEEEMYDRKKQNGSRMHGTISDCEVKKAATLNLNHYLQVEDKLLSSPQCNSEFSDASSSPVAFARRNVRRRLDAVMSSDSEEDHNCHGTPSSGSGLGDTHCETQDVESNSPSHCFPIEGCCLPSEQLSSFDGYKEEQKSLNCSGKALSPAVNSMSNLADLSSVLESSAVSEAEVINEIGLVSVTMSYSPHICAETIASMRNYLSLSSSPVENEKLCNRMHNDCGALVSCCESDKTTLHREVISDSHTVHEEDVARLNKEFAECSCSNVAQVATTLEKPRSYCPINNVEGIWQRLRNCRLDLKQNVTPELKDASHFLKLASRMNNLISEADILLGYSQPHSYDLLESYRWYDDQLQMSSVFSQHGICFYAKEVSTLGSDRSCWDTVDLALEMLSSSRNTMAVGKLLTLDKRTIESTELSSPIKWGCLRSNKDSILCNVLQSAVSSRACLALQGDTFHEYLSSLSQISRSEALQISGGLSKRKQRRGSIAQHYLSSGTYSLSTEDISLLSQCNSYGKVSSQSGDSCIR